MKYYAIVSLNMRNDSWVSDYLPNVTALVEQHGGRYLARTGNFERVEGDSANPDICPYLAYQRQRHWEHLQP